MNYSRALRRQSFTYIFNAPRFYPSIFPDCQDHRLPVDVRERTYCAVVTIRISTWRSTHDFNFDATIRPYEQRAELCAREDHIVKR